MTIESIVASTCADPFPVYPELADALAAAHVQAPLERDATVATCSGPVLGTPMLTPRPSRR